MRFFYFVAIIACIICFVASAEAQQKDVPIIKLFDKEYYKYEVQPSETLYGLSRRFQVLQEEIIAMNPFLVEGLKTGQILIIPLKPNKPWKELSQDKIQPDPDIQLGDSLANYKESNLVLFEKWEYDHYTVEKWRENLSDIASFYGLNVEELRKHNPNIPDRLSRGSLLMIPVKKQKPTVRDSLEYSATQDSKPQIFGKPSIAVLLPFMLDDTALTSVERYVEFYEGILLAADSLRQLNISFDLSVFDTGNSEESIRRVLSSGRLERANYIIAAANSEQIGFLSDWCEKEKKFLILPFSSRIPETENNPYIYQINPPQALNHKRLLDVDTSSYSNKNILFIRTHREELDERSELFSAFKIKLRDSGIPFRELTDAPPSVNVAYSFPDSIAQYLSIDKENLIIPAPFALTESNRVITLVGSAANIKSKACITLLGYPEWIALSKNNLPQLYQLNTHIYSNYYADFQNEKLKKFQIRYAREFGKELLNTYPRYAIMGYDIMMFFVPKISGSTIEAKTLQHDFNFVTNGPRSGKYNQNLFIIHYTPQRKIESILLP